MGAGCSNPKSVKVVDAVKAQNINELTKEAQEQLKIIQKEENLPPPGTPQKIKDKLKMSKDKGIDITNKDGTVENVERLKHQELWEAVEINDPKRVRDYIESYEEKNNEELKENELYDQTGNTVIHKAASLGHSEILMILLERTEAKPDMVNSVLATPLHLACRNNRIEAAKFLIGLGVDVNQQDEHGQVPLLVCCIHGHFDLAKLIIDASISGLLPEPIDIDLKDQRGLSPLNCAAIKGDFDMVKLLVINGSSHVDQSSPKGCSPLLYAARGGYTEVVRFLILKGASVLRQDNAGGTVLHHAIEKGHMDVLEVLQEHGVDIYSAIDIPDNAGRTPIFEAVDNLDSPEILTMLTKDRKDGGFGAKVNILNYNGQTPLFSAAREGNVEVVKTLVDKCGAEVDLNAGELFKDEADEIGSNYESLQEKFFMDAYKNCMTPLHVATVLGYEDIMFHLIDKGANPNYQTKIKGYTCLHLAVLANKPEIIIELLTKTPANPYLPDFGGRTLQDMIEIFIPSYLESFKTLLDNLQYLKQKGLQEEDKDSPKENIAQLAQIPESENENESDGGPAVVATHYVNPNDERRLQGAGEQDQKQLNEIYNKKIEGEDGAEENKASENNLEDKKNALINFQFMDESEIKVDPDAQIDQSLELVYGHKVAHSINALDWKYKELSMKVIYKFTEKYLDVQNTQTQEFTLDQLINAAVVAIGMTCKEKVIKVFMISLQLLNLMTSSQKIEKSGKITLLKNKIVEQNIVLKYLQKSEEGNTRITNKIHESILDLSFNPEVGEAMTSAFILQRIQAHNRAGQQKKQQGQNEGDEKAIENQKIETEAGLGSYKGLLAQLALLYKFINSFGIASRTRGPLSVRDVLKSIIPAIQHPNQDVRNAAAKILLDVHKFSGCVTEEELETLNEKARTILSAKLKKIKVEKNLLISEERVLANNRGYGEQKAFNEEDGDLTESADIKTTIKIQEESISPSKLQNRLQIIKDKIKIIQDKSESKDWQEKEIALKEVEYLFKEAHNQQEINCIMQDNLLATIVTLLKGCLEANNMTIYLVAIDATHNFFLRALTTLAVLNNLESLLEPIILRTTDTNTRVRKKSVDLIFQVWNSKTKPQSELNSIFGNKDDAEKAQSKHDNMSVVIANVIFDQNLGEKSIIGRLGLMIKRSQPIDGSKDLALKPISFFLGKNYEELTEFACKWVVHKNTKVRQNALKLITEICRINCMDPRGSPFKQRIVNFILGLRANQRDPLIGKINEVCLKTIVANTSPGRAGSLGAYIDVDKLDLNISSKTRAASMDHMGAKRRLMSATRRDSQQSKRPAPGEINTSLPQIGNVSSQQTAIRSGVAQPTIVLPHSEPLTEEQKKQFPNLIELFGVQIITCLFSKSWSTRKTAIEKINEQLYNLDPNRRDAMSCEINNSNLPIELNFKTFLDLINEGIKDPVLNNYIALLELIQKALPIFFRFIQPQTIQNDLQKVVIEILKKSGDMKQKIREATINFCLYLSHQSPVGPEFMVQQVIIELDKILIDKDDKDTSAAQSFGNSQMITSCFSLLNSYQIQTQILSPERDTPALKKRFMDLINAGLRHSNPQVRKEAEKIFKTLFLLFGGVLEQELVDQKPQLVQKLMKQAKQETASQNEGALSRVALPHSTVPTKNVESEENIEKQNVARAATQIRDTLINQSNLKNVFEGIEEHLQTLKLPNPKKRLEAILEIKKVVSKKIVGVQMDANKAREMFEPLSMLVRQLLQEENTEIYLESLNFLKFIVNSLASNLSTLDLHLMMGSFIGIIVQNSVSVSNMRVQLSSDKVIVFFAKHNNIGPSIVAKEITKNISKINGSIQDASAKKQEILNDKKLTLLRFFGILHLLLQQFSIVLCYQNDFYTTMLEGIADSYIIATSRHPQSGEQDDIQIKQSCNQILQNLYAIDYKLLDSTVGKLNSINRKTPLRKFIIEHEQQQKQNKGFVDISEQQTQQLVSQVPGENDVMRDTAMSFASSTNRKSLFSPGSTRTGRALENSPGGMGSSQYQGTWGSRGNNDKNDMMNATIDSSLSIGSRRMMSMNEKRTPAQNKTQNENYLANHPISNLTQQSWSKQNNGNELPPIDKGRGGLNRTGVLLPKIDNIGTGLQTTYSFESGNQRRATEIEKAPQKSGDNQKFKTRSTGGAGFSSSNAPDIPHYEPSVQKRTPRRRISGVLGSQVTKQSIDQSNQGSIPKNSSVKQEKPPLYMANKKNESGKPPAYVPKTGFTSDIPPSNYGESSPSRKK